LTSLDLEEVSGIVDLLHEFTVVLEESFDFLVRQVDEHTCDFGGKGVALQLGDEIKDGVSNLLLHVRVSGNNGRDKLEGEVVESLIGSLVLAHGGSLCHGTCGCGHTHLHVHVTVASFVRHVSWGSSLVVSHVVVVAALVTVVRASSTVVTVVVVVVVTGTHVVSVLHRSSHASLSSKSSLLVLRDVLEELDKFVLELVLGGDVVPLSLLVVELLESLESVFILGFFVGDVTEFLEFVMADLQLTLVDGLSIQFLKGGLSLIGGLEADESVGFVGLVNGEHLDTLNLALTISGEKLLEVFVGGLGVEVLDVQVASLLGVLVLDGLTEEFFLSLGGTESGLDVKSLTFAHVFSVEGLNSLGSGFGSVLMVVLVFSNKADEGEFAKTFLINLDKRTNVTVRGEEGNQLFIRPVLGVVLDVEVVEQFSGISSVSGVPSDSEALFAGL